MRVTAAEFFVYAADLKCIARHELHGKGAGEKATLPPQSAPELLKTAPNRAAPRKKLVDG